ncbi:hypothetical protein ACLMJV_32680 [Sinorhizobium meliloti]|uniref:hypothetical protein n=1 Tax=Rhizobium meliloti TaxID=382 RepID=UPI00398CA3FD
MLTEIPIEGVGMYRLPNQWQTHRILKMAKGPNKQLAWLAFGLGMTLQQFKKLPAGKQEETRQAYNRLASPLAAFRLLPL